MNAPKIPIENIYYLFCYAWNRFEQAQAIPLGGTPSPDLPNLLGRVLLHGVRSLLRRGLDRGYQVHSEALATVRGHIELGASIRVQARNVRRLQCEFDELSHDLLHNQIVKASMRRLARAASMDSDLSHQLNALARQMSDVSDIRLERSAFARVQLNRNSAYYDLLLKVAELAYDGLLPDPNGGSGFRFVDVLRDERKMARVFESFVRNFYRLEQNEFIVEPLSIAWDAEVLELTGAGQLPGMRVDVFLRSQARRVIIDTKYYANALQSHFDTESFHSGNLYQLFSYLKNAAGRDPTFGKVEGILLYPRVGVTLNERFRVQGHSVTIATVNLNQPWVQIGEQLKLLLRDPRRDADDFRKAPVATLA